ncbi:transporter substrate-binding domain-containing protein [Vibrio cyclitrophicus]|nr:transporter substrate-binding domain-containing protein [Vibrio cyclitrophicus]UPR48359.1 transporter substrate-binding domain-containing protein [Vibrio cyclitrophicus]
MTQNNLINHFLITLFSLAIFIAPLSLAKGLSKDMVDNQPLLFGMVANTECTNDCAEITNTFFTINNDYLDNIATAMNTKISFKSYPNLTQLFEAIEHNEVLGAAGFSRTRQREEKFIFSNPFFTSQVAVWYSNKNLAVNNPKSLLWTCVRGSSYCQQLRNAKIENIYLAPNLREATESIKRGRANALISSFVVLSSYLDRNNIVNGMIDTPNWVKKEQVGLIASKKNKWLVDSVNAALSLEHSEENIRSIASQNPYHLIEQLLTRYILNNDGKKSLTYSSASTSYPFLYKDDSGNINGFLYDFFELLESRSGLNFEYLQPNKNTKTKLSSYTSDIVPVAYTDRKETANWQLTEPFMSVNYVALSRSGGINNDSLDKKIGILSGENEQGLVHLVGWRDKKVKQYTNLMSLVSDLLKGSIAIGYVPQEFTHSLVLRNDVGGIEIGEHAALQVHLALATKNNPDLNALLNSLFTSIDQNELQKLMRSYRSIHLVYGYSREQLLYIALGAVLAIILSAVFVYFFISNLKLKIKLAESNANQEEKEKNWLKTVITELDSWIFIHDHSNQLLLSNCAKYLNNECTGCSMHSQKQNTSLVDNAIELNNVLKGNNISDNHKITHCLLPLKYVSRHRKMIKSLSNNNRYVLTILTDISEQKQRELDLISAREEAQLAVSSREKFLATMSHELRTPIAAIQGLLELISLRSVGKKSEELLEQAQKSTKHLNRLVDEVLDYSKLNANQLLLNPIDINILELLCESIRSFESAALSKGLSYQVDIRPLQTRYAKVDEIRIVQIINNILSNAIKFTDQGYVQIQVSGSDSSLKLTVTDSGIGMSQDQVQTIFKPFTQADAGVTRQYGGTGLGLSIVEKLVVNMGGTIEIDSIPNVGTSFGLTIPIEVSQQRDQQLEKLSYSPTLPVELQQWCRTWKMSVSTESPDVSFTERGSMLITNGNEVIAELNINQYRYPSIVLEHLMSTTRTVHIASTEPTLTGKVLVAEDNRINQNIIKMQLTEIGIDCHIVDNGKKALDYLQNNSDLAVILTDFHMPVMDGIALTRAIKSHKKLATIPVIGLTAEDPRVANKLAEECGLDDVLCKPYDIQSLESLLSKYMTSEPLLPHWLSRYPHNERIELADIFIQSMVADMHTLQKNESMIKKRKALHSMKGALATVGLNELSHLCDTVDSASSTQYETTIENISLEIDSEIEKVATWRATCDV